MTEVWTPELPFAIVAYDRNGVIGYGDHMAYTPREELLTDHQNMWAVLTNPERPVTLIGGRVTLMPLLGVFPPAIKEVIVVSSRPDLLTASDGVTSVHWRVAPDPLTAMKMAKETGNVPAIFGGASIYKALLPGLSYVLATEIDTVFDNVHNEPVKQFPPLSPYEWDVRSNDPMSRGSRDAFDARFVTYERTNML